MQKNTIYTIISICILFIFHALLYATEDKGPQFDTIILSGYINFKAFYDTRQVVGIDDDQTLFFPKAKDPSPTGDINAKGQGQMLPIETRARLTMFGPQLAEYVQEKGVIEVEFRGTNDIVNLINMRHAFGQLDIHNSTFIFGQTWHPLNVDELLPKTVSFNEGRPFAVYNRSPQLKYIYHAPYIDIILYAGAQVDFISDGPIGLTSRYARNAVIPNLHFQLKGFFDTHVVGAGIDYQRIAPRLVSDTGYKVRENLSSLTGIWYFGLIWPKIEIRSTLLFGGNVSNYGIIGGYGIVADSTNPVTGKQQYATTRTLTTWLDITILPDQPCEPGLFLGIGKNFGSTSRIAQNLVNPEGIPIKTIFGLGNDIGILYRVSPRIRFNIKQVTFGLEIEYTRASHGVLTPHAHVTNPIPVANTQILFSTFFFF